MFTVFSKFRTTIVYVGNAIPEEDSGSVFTLYLDLIFSTVNYEGESNENLKIFKVFSGLSLAYMKIVSVPNALIQCLSLARVNFLMKLVTAN